MEIDFHVFVDNFVAAVEAKDSYTAGHSDRVAELSIMIARVLKKDKKFCFNVHMAGHLHDIGKIGIADGILLKSGKLNSAEYEVMKTHSEIGYNILKNNEGLYDIARIILSHHERYDGNGYPDGLSGTAIPLGARIISVADAFDAMVTKRSYKDTFTIPQAIKEIEDKSGTQFDPEIAKVFLEILRNPKKLDQIKTLIRNQDQNIYDLKLINDSI